MIVFNLTRFFRIDIFNDLTTASQRLLIKQDSQQRQ